MADSEWCLLVAVVAFQTTAAKYILSIWNDQIWNSSAPLIKECSVALKGKPLKQTKRRKLIHLNLIHIYAKKKIKEKKYNCYKHADTQFWPASCILSALEWERNWIKFRFTNRKLQNISLPYLKTVTSKRLKEK